MRIGLCITTSFVNICTIRTVKEEIKNCSVKYTIDTLTVIPTSMAGISWTETLREDQRDTNLWTFRKMPLGTFYTDNNRTKKFA